MDMVLKSAAPRVSLPKSWEGEGFFYESRKGCLHFSEKKHYRLISSWVTLFPLCLGFLNIRLIIFLTRFQTSNKNVLKPLWFRDGLGPQNIVRFAKIKEEDNVLDNLET